MWCVPKLTPLFRERMDGILAVYTNPLPNGHELHCMDETPKQPLGTPHGFLVAREGVPRRTDYEYERLGRANVFVAVAPFQGTRTVTVTPRRTAEMTAAFLWNYCMVEHGKAERIHMILDNLNTHKEACLRKTWGDEKADAFFARVELHFTPPHASWLNMAEMEIGCVKRQGLRRRISTFEALQKTAAAIVAWRNERVCKIRWSFTRERARKTFPSLYMAEN